MDTKERLLSVPEVAEYLGVSESKIRKDIRQRTIPYVKLGSRILFDPKRIVQYVSDRAVEPDEPPIGDPTRWID